MQAKKQRIPTSVKIITALLVPVILTAVSLYVYGVHIQNEDRIYPNIVVAGIDVSGLTRQEAVQALGLPEYERRSAATVVTLVFPDQSELVIEGNDAKMQHNARDIVGQAHSIGRGQDVFRDLFA